jgi:hypothetical protein
MSTFASALAMLVVIGCGTSDELGKRYPVYGTVTYKGTPLEVGTITFYATGKDAEARGARGSIKDGADTLSTIGGDDGAFPGDYEVAVAARAPDMSLAKANQEKTGGSMRQYDVAKAFKTASSPIPKKYESTNDSGLKAKVEARSNKIDFELTDRRIVNLHDPRLPHQRRSLRLTKLQQGTCASRCRDSFPLGVIPEPEGAMLLPRCEAAG